MDIEHDIPIPSLKTGSKWDVFKRMNVGDSILIPAGSQKQAAYAARDRGIRIARRKQPDGNIRIWRVAPKSED
ncbi:MAG: hypothetical protein NTW87_11530 [Planctomycetota bacterium]|nr:hypothetical protein [Planctomycetota bacterium]